LNTKVLDSTKVDLRESSEGRKIGRVERRDEMGGVGAKSRVDPSEMGSKSSLGGVTSLNSG